MDKIVNMKPQSGEEQICARKYKKAVLRPGSVQMFSVECRFVKSAALPGSEFIL
jgi:hypothetical protein